MRPPNNTMTGAPQLLREVLLDPFHIVPQPGTFWHPQLDQSQFSIQVTWPVPANQRPVFSPWWGRAPLWSWSGQGPGSGSTSGRPAGTAPGSWRTLRIKNELVTFNLPCHKSSMPAEIPLEAVHCSISKVKEHQTHFTLSWVSLGAEQQLVQGVDVAHLLQHGVSPGSEASHGSTCHDVTPVTNLSRGDVTQHSGLLHSTSATNK